MWHERIAHVVRDVERDCEPALEPHLHDVEVATEELDLAIERNLLLGWLVERVAEELAQPGDHPPNAPRVALDQAGDGVERVEEEVRVELRPQQRQLGFGELGIELGGLGLEPPRVHQPHLRLQEIIPSERGTQDGEVDDEVADELATQDAARATEPGAVGKGEQVGAKRRQNGTDTDCDAQSEGHEKHAAAHTPRPVCREPADEPDDGHGERRQIEYSMKASEMTAELISGRSSGMRGSSSRPVAVSVARNAQKSTMPSNSPGRSRNRFGLLGPACNSSRDSRIS